MKDKEDIRWIQRFANFSKAFKKLETALAYSKREPDNELYQMALIQAFEFTFELGWKTVKDYLYYSGLKKITLPREVIKHGFQHRIIKNGQMWIDMMEDRNLMAHTCNEEKAKKAIEKISQIYGKGIEQLYHFFKSKLKDT